MAATRTKAKPRPEEQAPGPRRWPTIFDKLEERARAARLADPRGEYQWQDYTAPDIWPFTVDCLDGLEAARKKAVTAYAKALKEHDADMPGRFDRTHKYTTRWKETGVPSPPWQELYGDPPPEDTQDAAEAPPEPAPLETAPKVYQTLLGGARARVGTEDPAGGGTPAPCPPPAAPETPEGDGG